MDRNNILLPKSAMLLNSETSETISFAIRSSIVSNGNIVMKEIQMFRDTRTWELKIRGKHIDLEKFWIDSKVILTHRYITQIIKAASAIELCMGVKI